MKKSLFAFIAILMLAASAQALTRVLASEDIDFICSSYTYDNKYVGGPHNSQSLPEAANLHGKLYFSETDTETHLTKRQWRWGDSLRNPETWTAILARLRRNGATALWVYATGYIDARCDAANMSALTGIKLAEDMRPGELHVDVTNREHPITRDLRPGLAYGTDERVSDIVRYYDHQIYLKDPRDPGLNRDLPGFRIAPRFYADDPEAAVLGTLGAGIDKPGLVVKQMDGWRSIYSGAPIVPSSLLRGIARWAGVHIYSDADDVVTACANFLCLYAPKGGTRIVRLPRRATVVDLIDGRTLAREATEFPLEMAANTAVLLKLEK